MIKLHYSIGNVRFYMSNPIDDTNVQWINIR